MVWNYIIKDDDLKEVGGTKVDNDLKETGGGVKLDEEASDSKMNALMNEIKNGKKGIEGKMNTMEEEVNW